MIANEVVNSSLSIRQTSLRRSDSSEAFPGSRKRFEKEIYVFEMLFFIKLVHVHSSNKSAYSRLSSTKKQFVYMTFIYRQQRLSLQKYGSQLNL